MNKYDEQYYIVSKVFDENTLYLKALKKTANRKYSYKEMVNGDEPLFFENSYKDRDIKDNINRPILKSHMNMNHVLVNNDFRNIIKNFMIDGLKLYPSVIIDDKEHYHEGYWLFNIYKDSNFLNLDNCKIDNYDKDEDQHSIEKYSLDEKILDLIDEEQRLIFRPTKTDMGHTMVHQRIVDIFKSLNVDNIKFYKLSEWEDGMQFRK
jgi:hypothetical protein